MKTAHHKTLTNKQKVHAAQVAFIKERASAKVKLVESNITGYLEMNHELFKEWVDTNDIAQDSRSKLDLAQTNATKRLG